MTKASDNAFPSLLITEGSAPSSPSAGNQRLFIDVADHLVKVKNSSGTVTSVGGGGGFTFSGARAYHNTTQSINSGAERTVALNAERFDTDTYHDTSTNNSRLTVPTTAKYWVGANIGYGAANSGAGSYAAIKVNGSVYAVVQDMANRQYGNLAALLSLSASDYVELILSVGTSQTLQAGDATNQHNCELFIERMS